MIARAPVRSRRVAIYCRKSATEGLQQEFNSLDAQREACEAYVRSQQGEGWVALDTQYQDGGYSGSTTDRPGFQRLLDDIERGLIDIVAVYKIDRLSRSLRDFAKLIDLFERREVTFVSVTQQFSTATSMGRLTLNILMSFAEFEREVIGERIKDKKQASRSRGMWTGGRVPLGFVVVNKNKWESLSKADRDAIDAVSGEAYARLAGKVLAKQQDDILAARKAEGRIKSSVADPQMVDAFRKALSFFDQEWIAAAKAKGIDGDAALKYFRDEAAAYEKTRAK